MRNDYAELARHVGHHISLHSYPQGEFGPHVTIECDDCDCELHSEAAPHHDDDLPELDGMPNEDEDDPQCSLYLLDDNDDPSEVGFDPYAGQYLEDE